MKNNLILKQINILNSIFYYKISYLFHLFVYLGIHKAMYIEFTSYYKEKTCIPVTLAV